jgi:hypothetical protein
MKSLYRSIDTRVPTGILELTSDLDIAALYFPRLIERTRAMSAYPHACLHVRLPTRILRIRMSRIFHDFSRFFLSNRIVIH